jgi:hypothetical protein
MYLKTCGPIRGRPTRCCEETRQIMYYNVKPWRFRATIVAVENNTYFIFWVCVCSLRYPEYKAHAPIRVPSRACLAVTYFSILSHKRHDFRKKLLNIKCMFGFCLQHLSEIFLILKRIKRDIILNFHRFSCKVPSFLQKFNGTWIFSNKLEQWYVRQNWYINILCIYVFYLYEHDGIPTCIAFTDSPVKRPEDDLYVGRNM